MAVGNGGWGGAISFDRMAGPLSRHYAVASTDTGHEGTQGDANFAPSHPEKGADWAHRAVHEMTGKSKQILAAYYGKLPVHAYWNGCSTGGRQGLMEVQRYSSRTVIGSSMISIFILSMHFPLTPFATSVASITRGTNASLGPQGAVCLSVLVRAGK